MSLDDIAMVPDSRIRECRIERRAHELWLARLGWTNLITIVLPAGLAVFAGATILGDLLGPELSVTTGGIAALLSAIATAIHKALNCDEHQAECHRLAQAYAGLETRYRTLKSLDPADMPKRIEDLDDGLARLREGAKARVPDRLKKEARREDTRS